MTRQTQEELLILCARLLKEIDKAYFVSPLMGSQPASDIAIKNIVQFTIGLIQDE